MATDYLAMARLALGITSTARDNDIMRLIETAKLDIAESGIDVENIENLALYNSAIITYVCANFGKDNPDFEKLNGAYAHQIAKMALLKSHTGSDES